jgi:DNA-binding XRE family transcriptional regulator
MDHNEYRDALMSLNLTQSAAARFVNVNERTQDPR